MHTILDWATCGKCSKPRCFEVLASDFHWASPQNFYRGLIHTNSLCADKQNELSQCADRQNTGEHSRCADKLTNKINWAGMLPVKVKGAHLLVIKTNSDVEMTDNRE